MESIKGDISVMPLTDLLQWIDMCQKTGTINIHFYGIEKKIYVEDGKIVYVSSNKEGERLGEFISKGSYLETNKIKSALIQSQTMKVPFTQRLIELNYFTREQLTEIITTYAKELLLDAISWKEGSFEFVQGLIPTNVINGPIKLNTSEIIFDVFKYLEDITIGMGEKT
jgi:hypothetical protein